MEMHTHKVRMKEQPALLGEVYLPGAAGLHYKEKELGKKVEGCGCMNGESLPSEKWEPMKSIQGDEEKDEII